MAKGIGEQPQDQSPGESEDLGSNASFEEVALVSASSYLEGE